MVVLLVIATFAILLLIDYLRSPQPVLALQPRPAVPPAPEVAVPRTRPALVNGFFLPENLRYHPGHAWALSEGPQLVRVGLDDFAARLTGKLDRLTLPQRGQWLRQGEKTWTLHRDGAAVDMVSPIEGEVTDVNPALLLDPDLARRDPYGEGWLLTVKAPDARTSFRNLLGGSLARFWMEDSARRLQRHVPEALGAVAQDGGVALADLTTHMPDAQWTRLAREFFLS
ncbi:MAG TPA: glycine cleavage system protein H [Terriglobales bacterium]|nr:glycine cleavage system protein H [Terriglobales bacterium]